MKLILLVFLVAFATAKLGEFNYNLPLELHVNIIKTIMPLPKYIFIDNSLQDVKQLEALKDIIVEDKVDEPNETLDKIEEGNIIYQLNYRYGNPSNFLILISVIILIIL